MPSPPVKIDPNAPANATQVVVLASNDVQKRLIEYARNPGKPKLRLEDFEDELIERLSCGQSLLSACREPTMPSYSWVQSLSARDSAFADRLDKARARGMEALVDLQFDIMSGGEFSTGETMRDREYINAIRWTAAKRNAARFGEKITAASGVIIISRPDGDDGIGDLYE